MKVICDNCRAVYKIPDEKLIKPVNKASCRQCGHRMLIPRPRRDADPNERTLVTAVPPTPPGAPAREAEPKLYEEEESTMPGGGDPHAETALMQGPLVPGTPVQALKRGDEYVGYDEVSPTPRQPEPRGVRPTNSAASIQPGPRPDSIRAIKDPTTHDPRGDMSFVLLAALASVLGAFLLAFLNHPIAVFVGLTLTLGAGLTTMFVVLIGSRGRKSGRKIISGFLGVPMGGVAAFLSAVALWGINNADGFDFSSFNFSSPPPVVADAMNVVEPDPIDVPDPDAIEGEGEVAEADPEVMADTEPDRARPRPRPRPKPSTSDENVRDPRITPDPKPTVYTSDDNDGSASIEPEPDRYESTVEPEPKPRPKPAPEPEPEPDGGDDQMESVPMEVIDVMLRNNIEVKRCFFKHKKDTGTLPKRVDVRFTLESNGSVTTAGITQADFAGTDLDRCLSRSIKEIQFPSSSSPVTKITFPFTFQ